MGLSRRQFTREFKLAAIERLERGASVAEVARAFEVNPNTLHRWRREFRQGPGQPTFRLHSKTTGRGFLVSAGPVLRYSETQRVR